MRRDDRIGGMGLRKISLKYEARCINCGRKIPAGETAFWEAEKGVWHLECEERGADTHAQQKRAYQISSPRNFYIFLGGITILAFILGGLVLGPAVAPNMAYFPAKTAEQPVTLTLTETSLITVTQSMTQIPLTSALTQKWLNPSDSSVISWTDASKYVGKTKTVEGTIVRTFRSSTNTIFLNFHDPYQGYFCGVIFASDLSSFPFKPEDFYRGKEVRITGLIKLYQGAPEIIVENPSQIEVANVG
jgi:hypothetical protein